MGTTICIRARAGKFQEFSDFSVLARRPGEESILPPFHFLRRNVLHVRGDAPLLAEGIGQLAVAVSPEHVLHRHIDTRSAGDRGVENRIHVWHIQMDIYGVAGAGLR